MNRLKKSLVAGFLLVLLVLPELAHSQIVFVICRKYIPEKNCYRCSQYFSVRSEDAATARCGKMGYGESFYFPSVGAVFRWKVSNCTCGE